VVVMSLEKSYNQLYSKNEKYKFMSLDVDRWPRNRYEAALRFLDIKKTDKVLYIGFGRGDLLNYIQDKTNFAYGIDVSKGNIEIAKKLLNKNVKLSIQDVNNKTNFPDNYFDIIVLTDVIEHLVDRYSIIKELKRILKKDGLIFIGTPNIANIRNRVSLLFGNYPYTSGYESPSKNNVLIYDGGHIQWFTFKTIKELAELFDFKIVKTFGYGRFGKLHNIYPSLLSGAIGIILKK